VGGLLLLRAMVGRSILCRCLVSWWVRDPVALTVGCKGTSGLWIVGKP
jgi:hypothetical protein